MAGQLHYVHVKSFPVLTAKTTGAGDTDIDVGVFTINTVVEGDTNGDRVADFQIELTGKKFIDAADFIL